MSAPEWLTVRSVSKRLGVPARTVRRWCRDGHIPLGARWQPSGFGGNWLIAREWIASAPVDDMADMADMAVSNARTTDMEG